MNKAVLVRCGEIFLKGKNINYFERALVKNIKSLGQGVSVKNLQRKLLVFGAPICKLRNIFGITSLSEVMISDNDMESIKSASLKACRDLKKEDTFKVRTKRTNKKFAFKSGEVNAIIGELISAKYGAKVDLNNPDFLLGIDILEKSYIYNEIVPGPGGMPVGTQGRVLVLLDDEFSVLAALSVMKRGCVPIPIAFGSVDPALLKKFGFRGSVKVVSELKSVAADNFAGALAVSDRINNLKVYDVDTLVLRPLVGFSDTEIRSALEFYEGV